MKKLPVVKALLICLALLFPLNAHSGACEMLYDDWMNYKRVFILGTATLIDIPTAGVYGAYIIGVVEGIMVAREFAKLDMGAENQTIFLDMFKPKDSPQQNFLIVGHWLEENPKEWDTLGSICIFKALSE